MPRKLTSLELAVRAQYRSGIVARMNRWLGAERTHRDLITFMGMDASDKNIRNKISALVGAEFPNYKMLALLDERLPL